MIWKKSFGGGAFAPCACIWQYTLSGLMCHTKWNLLRHYGDRRTVRRAITFSNWNTEWSSVTGRSAFSWDTEKVGKITASTKCHHKILIMSLIEQFCCQLDYITWLHFNKVFERKRLCFFFVEVRLSSYANCAQIFNVCLSVWSRIRLWVSRWNSLFMTDSSHRLKIGAECRFIPISVAKRS